uniref:Carboxylic ester hydrolase n=1 Tax=Timema californicum TaxID=61474 RepID=A0A7R9P2Z3_TIMCA|nr:unnamed protein product [Timema californicum]
METVKVRISQGELQGKKVSSKARGVFYSFQGIPYAKPPVGPLRFKPPEPPEPWAGVRDARKEGANSPQLNMVYKSYSGDENCLFLNVYTPQWPVSRLKPVMVWIHGGGFEMGSGDSSLYGPDYFLAQDVVFVTINYRLGALGFLNLDGSDVSANNALRDQVMALTWVNKNISKFGGDPDNVTLFGESAGAACVHYLFLAPSAKGLFHKAIAQSGSALIPVCHFNSSVSTQRAFRLGQVLGCETKDPQHLADFLRTVPAEKIVLSQGSAESFEDSQRVMQIPFPPTEELDADAFIPGDPIKLLKEGRFHKVPFIIGVNSAEGKLALTGMFNCCDVVEIEKDFQRTVPWNLSLGLGTQTCKDIADKLRKFYFGNKPVNEKTVQNYVDMQSDLHFNYGFYKSVKLQVEQSNSPIYAYEYDHKKPIKLKRFPSGPEYLPGTGHGEELFLVFCSSFFPNDYGPYSEDAIVRNYSVKFWTNFAKTGNPNIPEEEVEWPAVTKEDLFYLKISPKLGVLKDFRKERMDFLDHLFDTHQLTD